MVTGTIPNCGLYYTVQEGEICDDVTIRFSLTFDQFIAMNPSIDSKCSNLLYGEFSAFFVFFFFFMFTSKQNVGYRL